MYCFCWDLRVKQFSPGIAASLPSIHINFVEPNITLSEYTQVNFLYTCALCHLNTTIKCQDVDLNSLNHTIPSYSI